MCNVLRAILFLVFKLSFPQRANKRSCASTDVDDTDDTCSQPKDKTPRITNSNPALGATRFVAIKA